MNKFLHHLKSKGYEINGNTAMLLGVKFKICNGTIKTARGLKNSYWLELAWNDDFKKGIINMTAKELKKKLIEGYRLKDLFHFSDGQDCIIYKSDFEITDDIIYIPDIDLNEINIDTKLNKEEIKNVLHSCYTGNDFVEECNGHKDVAEELFEFVDWQHPNIMDMLETYGENEFEEKYGFSIEELE